MFLKALIALSCAGAVACGARSTNTALPPFSECRLEPTGTKARCTTVSVFENRETREGRVVELRVAVLPALGSSPRPDPLFMLVGGPGQAATEAGPRILEALRDVRRSRDVVLVDQRGTGASNPLDCEDEADEPLARRFAPSVDLAQTRKCRAALDADTTQYVTPIAMADLDDVRRALGYERINLWGGSYGTRAALVYYRQYPERVRSLILDGAAPTNLQLQLLIPRQAQRALDLALGDCEKDVDCNRAFADTRRALHALLERLSRVPYEGRISHPRTHVAEELRVDRNGLSMAVLSALYVPDLTRLLPLAVERARAADYGPWVAMASAFSESLGLSSGMFLSVVCAEDLSRFSTEEVREMTAGTFLGPEWLERMRAECTEWPSAILPDSYFSPVAGDVPALVLSGDLDPVTPPAFGELAAAQLASARHVIVPGAGHGVSVTGCVPDLIDRFLETTDAGALDLACLDRLKRPAFFTSLAGPRP